MSETVAQEKIARHLDSLDVAIATNYLETIRMMASVGLGWTILPRSMVDDSLTTLEVDGVALERTLGCASRAASTSAGYTLAPPVTIMSLRRSARNR